ncbi:hypothetical protein [Lentzea sp. NEAU-D7]|uniref:hypothetical protein n=1 Tax=Lentzea sp. NEAU-D7 TaxID=2994667 RepID=UPI00224A845C|nr:hypothetical protein [Lentzea sp. NEAU-D7]MCX2948655.1 hypothetical protein [Lentzea sp. NEAU-D7]MCX2951213.1 hypothetical protein [Lentzea sp. NEAU-D7]
MSYVVLLLFVASVLAGVGALGAMVFKKEPFYGVVGLVTICVPSSLLAFLYLAVA